MLIRNQNWEYPARVYTYNELLDTNYNDEGVNYIYHTSQVLKRSTEALRRGEFTHQHVVKHGDKGILLDIQEGVPSFADDINNEMSPHWREFAAALKHFKPAFDVLPDDCDTSITFNNVQLNQEMTQLVEEALMNLPFKNFALCSSYRFHGGMSTIAQMMGSNRYLQKLDMYRIQDMDRHDITNLCSAIHCHPSLVDVAFDHCFTSGWGGDEMLNSLLRTDNDLKLERLSSPKTICEVLILA